MHTFLKLSNQWRETRTSAKTVPLSIWAICGPHELSGDGGRLSEECCRERGVRRVCIVSRVGALVDDASGARWRERQQMIQQGHTASGASSTNALTWARTMWAGTPGCQRRPNPNKRVNVEATDLDAEADYPHKNFKVSTPVMDGDFETPFQQRLKAAFTTPSSARTVTPVSPRISAKRDMVHRLRQQLKNRDEMIMQMQTQILEQARVIHMHQLRMGDLEELIRTTNRSLFEAEQEIDYLRKLLAESCTCRPASCQVRKRACLCNKDVKVRPLKAFAEPSQWPYGHQHQDMKTLVSEARRLTEELKILGESKRERERIVVSRAGEHEMNIRRINLLESELAEARQVAFKNASLFESCERERARLSGALSELQQKLESQAIKLEHMRAYTNSKPFGATAELLTSDGHASNNIVNPGVPVCSSTTDSSRKSQFSNDSSGVSKPGSHTSQFLKETPGRMVDGDIGSLLSTLQQELDQLLSRLANNNNLREDEFRPELQPSFQNIASSSQVQELTSKFHQIAGLQATSMPELSNYRETILALNEKLSILSDNFSWFNSNRAVSRKFPQETTRTSEIPKDEAACRDIKVVFGQQNGSTFISPDYRESSTNSQTAQRCGGYSNNWSLGEEVARLSVEMEQVMVEDKSFGSPTCSMDESTAVRIGSPTITGDRYTSLTNSVEDTKGSFGRFVFDIEQENAVLMLNQAGESCHETRSSSMFSAAETRSSSAFSAAETRASASVAALSPFSKMMAKLDLLRPSPAVSLTDSLVVAERFERSIGSVDSAFDRILDNTLDDMVRICSPCKTSTSSNSSVVDDQD